MKLVSALGVGKRLPGAVYVHRAALKEESDVLFALINDAANEAGIGPRQWNVVKLSTRDQRISLLQYKDFYGSPFPELFRSHAIDLATGRARTTDYGRSDNPPILHRKELLLSPRHERIQEYQRLTDSAEAAGLFADPKKIGFRKQWNRLIRNKGLALVDGVFRPAIERTPTGQAETDGIERHLTAIDRTRLSTPMQILAQHGYLDGQYSALDYGCGKGDDVRELGAHGIDVVGWDPVYVTDSSPRSADLVNLGFVINVIEDPKERSETLLRAYDYAKKVLVVSVMIGGESTNGRFSRCGDGVRTSRNTFQKYYTQQELRSYIEQVLGESPVAAKPGVFLVFRDKFEEQNFLLERQHVQREWRQLTARPRTVHEYLIPEDKIRQNLPLFEDFWQTALDLGRVPANDEFDFSDQLRSLAGSHKRAFESLKEHFETSELEEASARRLQDLTVFFALAAFDRRVAYARFSPRLRRDISAFFRSYAAAREEGSKLLYSIADLEGVKGACVEAVKEVRCGRVLPGHSLTVHRSLLEQLPPVLRVYVGCAGALYGDLDSVDLVKIHYTSPKVTFLIYDEYDSCRLPVLSARVKVNLATQRIDFFEGHPGEDSQLLYFKSDFDPVDRKEPEQVAFDRRLRQVIHLDENGLGPSLGALEQILGVEPT